MRRRRRLPDLVLVLRSTDALNAKVVMRLKYSADENVNDLRFVANDGLKIGSASLDGYGSDGIHLQRE